MGVQDIGVQASGTIIALNPSVGVNGAAEPGSTTQVGGTDGVDLHPVNVYPAGGAGEHAIGVELRNAAGEVGTVLNPVVVTGTVAAANPSVGLNGAAAPTSSTQAGGVDDATGNLEPLRLYATDGAGGELAQGVVLRASGAGASVEAGTAANPLRIDPTGTTPQPITSPALDVPLSTLATEATLSSIDTTLDVSLSTRAAAVTQTDGTQRTQITDLGGVTNATVKAASTPAVATDTALVVALSPNNPIAPPIGGGRTSKVFQNMAIPGVFAETLLSLVMVSNGVVAPAATSYVVPAGKTFRLTGFIVAWRSMGAPVNGVTVRVRITTGAAFPAFPNATPCIATLFAGALIAGIGIANGGSTSFVFSEGFELPSGFRVGLTQQATAAATGFDVQLIGYEY